MGGDAVEPLGLLEDDRPPPGRPGPRPPDRWLRATVHGGPDEFNDERQRLLVSYLCTACRVAPEPWAALPVVAWPAVTTAAVIFDCDGVLVDTEGAANAVLAEVLTDAGLPTTAEESMALYMGRSWVSCMAIATERFGRPLPEAELRERYRSGVRAAWARELAPVPGIVAALDAIAARGLPTCVASSGEHERMRFTLGRTGLLPRFDGRLFSATEVARGKPAPDLFLHAARTMGFDRATTVVVEDTVPGAQAGVAAGMRVLGFARQSAAADLAAAGAEPFADMARLPERL